MLLSTNHLPHPVNEPVRAYLPGSAERASLEAELDRQLKTEVECPLVIGGQEIRTGKTVDIRAPHDHGHKLGHFHQGTREHVEMAAAAARKAFGEWSRMHWEDRAAIFLRAADLLTGKYRDRLNAATMLGQSKNVMQAEIDSACELGDFLRFNPWFMERIYGDQPLANAGGTWNRVEYRPIEGFLFAITPFNFTAIAGNLPTSCAMMGNVVLWKPASTAVLSSYYFMKLLEEAGLPPGVINFIPGSGREIGDPVLSHPDFAGIHFTGSTAVFNNMWKTVGDNLVKNVYKVYPRIVGETGGKDFVIADADCDEEALATALFRGAFEYQGQKCSAASRAYVPKSIWPRLRERLAEMAKSPNLQGDVRDFRTFLGAVIDKASFQNIKGYIDAARTANDAKIVIGGECNSEKGWFIAPTVIETSNPKYKSMEEEIFGPVLTIFPYDDGKLDETLRLLDQTSPYALTGAVFARDRRVIRKMMDALTHAAGNFYINDKPTGAVVGQQPFGGGRMSGTNDKAGSAQNLLRWVSTRTIKENFAPPTNWKYPHQRES